MRVIDAVKETIADILSVSPSSERRANVDTPVLVLILARVLSALAFCHLNYQSRSYLVLCKAGFFKARLG